MNLHRAREKPDWEYVDPDKRNVWQRIAARTHGIVTPGNIITLAGVLFTLKGLRDVDAGKKKQGIAELAAGAIADLADGWAADKTGTKSPLGKDIDTFADKFAIAAALLRLMRSGRVPFKAGAVIVAHNAINAGLAVVGRVRDQTLDVTAEGKKMVGGQRAAVGGFVVASFFEDRGMHQAAQCINDTATVLTGVASGVGLPATIDYATTAFQPIEPNIIHNNSD